MSRAEGNIDDASAGSSGRDDIVRMAGPFDPAPPQGGASGLGDVVITGLLVIYPALAIVAAVVVGLRLSGAA